MILLYQAVQILYWLALSVWLGGMVFPQFYPGVRIAPVFGQRAQRRSVRQVLVGDLDEKLLGDVYVGGRALDPFLKDPHRAEPDRRVAGGLLGGRPDNFAAGRADRRQVLLNHLGARAAGYDRPRIQQHCPPT